LLCLVGAQVVANAKAIEAAGGDASAHELVVRVAIV
jgi:hypothetical protein